MKMLDNDVENKWIRATKGKANVFKDVAIE
jgi:hypothetical protein